VLPLDGIQHLRLQLELRSWVCYGVGGAIMADHGHRATAALLRWIDLQQLCHDARLEWHVGDDGSADKSFLRVLQLQIART
jgi:hypothetical protein